MSPFSRAGAGAGERESGRGRCGKRDMSAYVERGGTVGFPPIVYRCVFSSFRHVLCRAPPAPPFFLPLYRACISCISPIPKTCIDLEPRYMYSIHGPNRLFRYITIHDTCEYMRIHDASRREYMHANIYIYICEYMQIHANTPIMVRAARASPDSVCVCGVSTYQ